MKRLSNIFYTYTFFIGVGVLIRIGQRCVDKFWDEVLFAKEEEAEG